MSRAMKFLAILAAYMPVRVWAHTRYVTNEMTVARAVHEYSSIDVISNPTNVLIIAGTMGIIAVAYTIVRHSQSIKHKLRSIHTILSSYRHYVPWILRISLGILLISSSVHGTLVSPVVQSLGLSTLQFVLGFTILAGFLTTPSVIIVAVLYIIALTNDLYVLGNAEVFGACLAYLMIGIARPGIDDIFSLPHIALRQLRQYVPLVLRVTLGISFVYLALYEKFWNPALSFAVVKTYDLTSVLPVSPEMWVLSAGIVELFIGIAFIAGFRVRLMTAISFVVLTITLFGLREDVSAHITLFGVVSALFILGAGRWSVDSLHPVKLD